MTYDDTEWEHSEAPRRAEPGRARSVAEEHDAAWAQRGYDTVTISGLTRRFGHTVQGLLTHALLHRTSSWAPTSAALDATGPGGSPVGKEQLEAMAAELRRRLSSVRLAPGTEPDDGAATGIAATEGPGVLRAGDISWHGGARPADASLPLCTIPDGVSAEISVTALPGRGAGTRTAAADKTSADGTSVLIEVPHISRGPVSDVQSEIRPELAPDGNMEDALVLRIRCRDGYPAMAAVRDAVTACLDPLADGQSDPEWIRSQTAGVAAGHAAP